MVFEKKVFKTPNEIISKHRIKTFQNTENGRFGESIFLFVCFHF